MHDLLTRKKHSKRIAALALKAEIIDKKMFDSLYMDECVEQRRPKRKGKDGYIFLRYYRELCYGKVDYFGEYDNYSLVEHVAEILFWSSNKVYYTLNGYTFVRPIRRFNSTISIIKHLKTLINIRKSGRRL